MILLSHATHNEKFFWQVHQFEFQYKCITKTRFSGQKLFSKEMEPLIFLSRVKFSKATVSDLCALRRKRGGGQVEMTRRKGEPCAAKAKGVE